MTLVDDFHERHVPFEACFNFRDIGGYRTADGRLVRPGRYYRSGAVHRMTEADAEQARALQIASVIDLRRPDERGDTLGPLAAEPIRRHALSIIPISTEELDARAGRGISGERYMAYLELGADAFTRAFELLAREQSYPLVVHCSAGKDRTGVLTALVLDLLGVPEETIEADYVLTNRDVERGWRWLQAQGLLREDVRPEELGVPPDAIVRFFELFRAKHGTARDYARSIGVPDEALEAIRSLLLEQA